MKFMRYMKFEILFGEWEMQYTESKYFSVLGI